MGRAVVFVDRFAHHRHRVDIEAHSRRTPTLSNPSLPLATRPSATSAADRLAIIDEEGRGTDTRSAITRMVALTMHRRDFAPGWVPYPPAAGRSPHLDATLLLATGSWTTQYVRGEHLSPGPAGHTRAMKA